MKVCLLGDTHFGMRNDSIKFLDYAEKFYNECFFPYLIENDIKIILQLGDFFDKRKNIDFNTLARTKQMFLSKLNDYGIKMIVIAGNHDCYHKNTNKTNSLKLLLQEYNNIQVIDEPCTIYLTDDNDKFKYPIAMIPWICADNCEKSLGEIKNTKAAICVGHFEIAGFSMYRGMTSEEGLNHELFKRFDMVFSGHYHHRSHKNNIFYVGTPMESTWQDYDDPRGFHVFDLYERSLEFIKNPNVMFHRITYDDGADVTDFTQYHNSYVKVVVINKSDPIEFESFINKVHEVSPIDVNIVEDFTDLTEGVEDDMIDQSKSTLDIIYEFVDSINQENINQIKLKKLLTELYVEAVNITE